MAIVIILRAVVTSREDVLALMSDFDEGYLGGDAMHGLVPTLNGLLAELVVGTLILEYFGCFVPLFSRRVMCYGIWLRMYFSAIFCIDAHLKLQTPAPRQCLPIV